MRGAIAKGDRFDDFGTVWTVEYVRKKGREIGMRRGEYGPYRAWTPDTMSYMRRLPDESNFAGKLPTFAESRAEIFRTLQSQGWQVVSGLKVPHVTSPDGRVRLWFKAQAVYMAFSEDPRRLNKNMGDARSMHVEIRGMSGEQFLQYVSQWADILSRSEY